MKTRSRKTIKDLWYWKKNKRKRFSCQVPVTQLIAVRWRYAAKRLFTVAHPATGPNAKLQAFTFFRDLSVHPNSEISAFIREISAFIRTESQYDSFYSFHDLALIVSDIANFNRFCRSQRSYGRTDKQTDGQALSDSASAKRHIAHVCSFSRFEFWCSAWGYL